MNDLSIADNDPEVERARKWLAREGVTDYPPTLPRLLAFYMLAELGSLAVAIDRAQSLEALRMEVFGMHPTWRAIDATRPLTITENGEKND
jgi:hypothetical protein